jgi:short-subunit dehydrogenase
LAAKRNSAVYCATKAGLHIFSDSLRAQLAGSGVQVTEILPPTVETRMTAHRNVPKMQASDVARLTIRAITKGKRSVLLGRGKLLGVLLYLIPPLAKRMMLKF